MFDVKMVSEKIRDARIRKNMTQSNLADELGVSYQAVSNWERGNSLPDLSKYEDLCRILNVDLEYLLGIGADTDTVNRLLADGKGEAADVRVEEIASVAPLLPPDTLKEAVEASREKEPVRVEDLIALAPFLDRETLDRLAETAIVNDIETLVGIAPFVPSDTLARMVERAGDMKGKVNMEFLISIAPFLPKDMVGKLAEEIS